MQPSKPDPRQTMRRFVAQQTLQLSMAIACLRVVRTRVEQGADPADTLATMEDHLNLRLQGLAMQAAAVNNPALAQNAVAELLGRVGNAAEFKAVSP